LSLADLLNRHGNLLAQAVVQVAPSNPRNTEDPLDVDYRIEQPIKEHSNTARLWQEQLQKMYLYRS